MRADAQTERADSGGGADGAGDRAEGQAGAGGRTGWTGRTNGADGADWADGAEGCVCACTTQGEMWLNCFAYLEFHNFLTFRSAA